jgi:hypothetical protein
LTAWLPLPSPSCSRSATDVAPAGRPGMNVPDELAGRLVDPTRIRRGSRRSMCHNSAMDAAGALALRNYIEARNGGLPVVADEKALAFEPSAFPHIDAYLRAFHESGGEVTPK